jgi:hypothetical protein
MNSQDNLGSNSKPVTYIPIYLDVQTVLGLLSQLAGGFSNKSTVKTTAEGMDSRGSGGELGGSVGIPGGPSISAKVGRGKGRQESTKTEESRDVQQTPVSLFATLRNLLEIHNLITELTSLEDLDNAKRGSFVEFWATLKYSPVVEALTVIKQLASIASQLQDPKRELPRARKRKGSEAKSANVSFKDIDQAMAELIQYRSLDLIAEMLDVEGAKAVMSINPDNFIGQGSTELMSAEVTVLGKITRVLRSGSDNKIDLLRNSSLGQVERSIIEEFKKGPTQMANGSSNVGEFFKFDFTTELPAPAIQINPVAIYV